MRKLIKLFVVSAFATMLFSCEDQFLQVPDTTGTVNLDKIFSDSTLATQALVTNYRYSLSLGWGGFVSSDYQTNFFHGGIANISGEIVKGQGWHANYVMATQGPSPAFVNGVSLMESNSCMSIALFSKTYAVIRSNYLVIENIDRVPNMSPSMKETIKSESYGMIAYSYMYLFKNYGGVPLVYGSLNATDKEIKRSTVQETVAFIVDYCDKANSALPHQWPAIFNGRLTKAAVQTLKAEVLLIAARPLFNSATPYLNFGANNELICYGNASQERWTMAIDAAEAALSQARAEGKEILNTGEAGIGNPNPNAIADYGTATSTPSNSELILACHIDDVSTGAFTNTSYYQKSGRYNNQYGIPYNFLLRYQKTDGTEQDWPKPEDAMPRKGEDYVTRFLEMEPRFRVDFVGPGIHATDIVNNPGDRNWAADGWTLEMSNRKSVFPSGTTQFGCALPVKFYYKSGNRIWYEYPLFRVSQLYLELAEAYNEVGNSTKALANLNVVHNRAGLPTITETDKIKLRKIIQREWDVEFFDEGKRYYNHREWKMENIGDGGMYGPIQEFQFRTNSNQPNLKANLLNYWCTNTYTAYWNPKMFLEPFPQSEINKGNLIQNPAY